MLVAAPPCPAPRRSTRRLPGRPERQARIALSLTLTFGLLAAGCAAVPRLRLPKETKHSDAAEAAESSAEPSRSPAPEPDAEESSARPTAPAPEPVILVVKASAYNSRRGQTDRTPTIAAWGDRLAPGMKVIAVSKDLLERGLVRGQRVEIEGLEGEYVVLDRMPSRWREKIDIYMGEDVRAARQWGVRQVEIRWIPEVGTDELEAQTSDADSDATPTGANGDVAD